MTHDLTIVAVTLLSPFVGARTAYDCWPWEWWKTWQFAGVPHRSGTNEQMFGAE